MKESKISQNREIDTKTGSHSEPILEYSHLSKVRRTCTSLPNGWVHLILMPECLHIKSIVTRKREGVNHFHYYLCRQPKTAEWRLVCAYLKVAENALQNNDVEKTLEWYDSALALSEKKQEMLEKKEAVLDQVLKQEEEKMYAQYAKIVELYENWFQMGKDKGSDWVWDNTTYILGKVNYEFMLETVNYYSDIEHVSFMLYDINTDDISELFIVIDDGNSSCNAFQTCTFADGEMKDIGLKNFYKAGNCILCEDGIMLDIATTSALIEEFKFYILKPVSGEIELIDLIGCDWDGKTNSFYRIEKNNKISEDEFNRSLDLLNKQREGFIYTEANEENIELIK